MPRFDIQTAENPGSQLNQGPKPIFTSRYADPNHPASSGDTIALMTGGNLTMEKLQSWKSRQSQALGGRGASRGRGDFSGSPDDYYSQRTSDPNPPAPHGRPLSLRDIMSIVRDVRSPPDSAQSASRDYFDRSTSRDYVDRTDQGSCMDRKENSGLRSPISKIYSKVRNISLYSAHAVFI